jgi:hypothetical protein
MGETRRHLGSVSLTASVSVQNDSWSRSDQASYAAALHRITDRDPHRFQVELAVARARCLHCNAAENAAQFAHNESRQCLSRDVLSNDESRPRYWTRGLGARVPASFCVRRTSTSSAVEIIMYLRASGSQSTAAT